MSNLKRMVYNWEYLLRMKHAITASQKARQGLVKAFIEVMRTGRELRELGRIIKFPTMQDASIQTDVTVTEDEGVQTRRNEGEDVSTQTNLVDDLEFTSRETLDVKEEEEMNRCNHQSSVETDNVREFYFKTTERICYDRPSISHFERSEDERSSNQIIDVCFNCQSVTHRYGDCPYPTLHSFCFQCGLPEVTMKNCPRCTPGWKAQGSNYLGVTNDASQNRSRRKGRKDRYRMRRKASQYSRPRGGGRPTTRRERKRRLSSF